MPLTDHVGEAVKEGERVPLTLEDCEEVRLAVGVSREAKADGVKVNVWVPDTEKDPVRVPEALHVEDSDCEGEDVSGVADAAGEALPISLPLRVRVREFVKDTLSQPLRVGVWERVALAHKDGLSDAEGVPEAGGDADGECVPEGVTEAQGVTERVMVPLGEPLPERVALSVPDGERVPEAQREALAHAEDEGEDEGEGEVLTLGVNEREMDKVAVAEGHSVGEREPASVKEGEPDSEREPLCVALPEKEPLSVPEPEGEPLGVREVDTVTEGLCEAERDASALRETREGDEEALPLPQGVGDTERHAVPLRVGVPLPEREDVGQSLLEMEGEGDWEVERVGARHTLGEGDPVLLADAEGVALRLALPEPLAVVRPLGRELQVGDTVAVVLREGDGVLEGECDGVHVAEALPVRVPKSEGVRVRVRTLVAVMGAVTLCVEEVEGLEVTDRDADMLAEAEEEDAAVPVALGLGERVEEDVVELDCDREGAAELVVLAVTVAEEVIMAEGVAAPLVERAAEGEADTDTVAVGLYVAGPVSFRTTPARASTAYSAPLKLHPVPCHSTPRGVCQPVCGP